MTRRFLDIFSTPSIRAARALNNGIRLDESADSKRERLTPNEVQFISARDSFYMASVSESGWPYIQHRGGPPGFLRVLDDQTLAFADFRGNRQYISLGNLTAHDRVALFLMDYPNRHRLKILAHVEERKLEHHSELAEKLALPGYPANAERALILHLDAYDWNCSRHITPRFTESELAVLLAPISARIDRLESENASLRAQLAAKGNEE